MGNNVFMTILEKAEEKNKFNICYSLSKLKNEGLSITNKETAKAILSGSGLALKYCSKAIQSNKELVKMAVKQDGYALQYASEKLRDDAEVVSLAVRNSHSDEDSYYSNMRTISIEGDEVNLSSPLEWASDRLKDNKEFMLELFSSPGRNTYLGDIFLYMDSDLIADADFMTEIVKTAKFSCIKDYYDYTKFGFSHNKKVTMAIIEHCSSSNYLLEDIGLDDELLMDEEFATLAFDKLGDVFIDYLEAEGYLEVYLKKCLVSDLKSKSA